MTRDLGDLMWGAVSERSQSLDGLTPAAPDLVRLRTRVRRGRTMRHVRDAAVAVPVVAAVAAAGWFGVDRLSQPTPPAPATQEPVVPTPDATDDAAYGDLVTEPGLPSYYAMPDGLIEQTGPGWVVTVHRPMRDNLSADGEFEMLDTAMFLVRPDGTHFLVAKFEPDARVFPVSWTAGSTSVDVIADTVTAGHAEERPDQEFMAATFDLTAHTFVERAGDTAWPPEELPESPSGRVLLGKEYADTFTVTAEDGSDAELSYGVAGKDCGPVGWLDDDSFVALCVDDAMALGGGSSEGLFERDFQPALFEIGLDGNRVVGATQVRALGADDPLPLIGTGVQVRDGAVAFSSGGSPDGCETGVDVWADGELRPVQRPEDQEDGYDVATVGGKVYVAASVGCGGEPLPTTLTAHDLAAGTSLLLETAPADWRQGEPGRLLSGLSAWTVGE